MTSLRDAALDYLDRGWSVIPVRPNEKHPPLIDWKPFQSSLPSPEQVRDWWGEWPSANIAVITGQVSGLTVIDVDGEKGKKSFVEHLNHLLPKTRVHRTPRGHHVIFKFTSALTTGADFLPGIDIRSEGGYILAPPSIVAGQEYGVSHDRPFAALDGDIPEVLKRVHPKVAVPDQGDSQPRWVSQALAEGAAEGARNNTAIRLAGYFHSKGLPKDVVIQMMIPFGDRCSPPIDELELLTVVNSALRYPVAAAALDIEDAPEFIDEDYRYILRWDQHRLRMHVEHLTQDKDAIRCEITLFEEQEGKNLKFLYGPIKYNLLSTQDRTGLLKYLKDYKGLNAAEMMQNVTRLCVDCFRQGAPLVYLADVKPRTAERWALWPLILDGHANILFGDGGTAKSLIALASLMSLHSGEDLGLGVPQLSYRGCFLDWEFESQDHRERMLGLCHGDEALSTLTIMYKRCVSPIWEMVDEILEDKARHDIGFIVLDSALLAAGGEPEKADTVRKVFAALRKIGLTSLIIAHTTHDEERDKPFGSTFWYNMGRNIWKTALAQEETDEELHIMLRHTKSNVSRREKSRGYHISFAQGISINSEDPMTVGEFLEKAPLHRRVEQLLKDNGNRPMQDEEISKLLNADANYVRTMTYRHKQLFVRLKEGIGLRAREGV